MVNKKWLAISLLVCLLGSIPLVKLVTTLRPPLSSLGILACFTWGVVCLKKGAVIWGTKNGRDVRGCW